MRNLNVSKHGAFGRTLQNAGHDIKRIGGTMLAGAIITAIGFQSAPVDKAFAETQSRQEVNVRATRTKVVDYTAANDSTPATLKKRGVKIVVRYAGYQSGKYAWKNLKESEAQGLRKAGIDIVSVYETSASWMRGGFPAGVQAARIAKADIVANGGPTKPFVYFACDEDADYTGQVNAALRGAATVLGGDKVGVYGGFRVVDSALKTGSAAKAWQTQAWSRGKVAKNITLFQTIRPYAGDLGLPYDSNYAHDDDIGQWGTHAVTTGVEQKQAAKQPSAVTTSAPASAPAAAPAKDSAPAKASSPAKVPASTKASAPAKAAAYGKSSAPVKAPRVAPKTARTNEAGTSLLAMLLHLIGW